MNQIPYQRGNELYHYGVLGMKWGVRRDRTKLLGRKKKGKGTDDSDSQKQSISKMTDDELSSRISRLKMEKNYRELTATKSQKRAEKGKKFVEDVLTNSAKNIATQTVTYLMGKGINKALGKMFDDPNVVNPKKGQKDK